MYLNFLRENWYKLILFFIFLIAIYLRFYNFSNRWELGADEARDVTIAQLSLAKHELPLIGSFSSAGPFVFGPAFIWFIMVSYALFPFFVFTPWLVTEIVGIITVILLIIIARRVGGKKLAVVIGLLAATSPQLVIRSITLTQHTFVAPFATLLVLFFILFFQTKQMRYAFLMGISVGFALSMHYQSLNLLLLTPGVFFTPKMNAKHKIYAFLLLTLGFILPLLPLLYWDSFQEFANLRNFLDYLLIGQYRLYVPNSWKLFLFSYLPTFYAFVAGGSNTVAFILLLATFCAICVSVWKHLFTRSVQIIASVFILLLILNRYYHGERSEGYLIYFVPFIILFSGWSINLLVYNEIKNKLFKRIISFFGVALMIIIIIGNCKAIFRLLPITSSVKQMQQTADYLSAKYPNKKFTIYDYESKAIDQSEALSVILHSENKTSPNGIKLGIICGKCRVVSKKKVGYVWNDTIILLTSKDLSSKKWNNVNPEGIYDALIGWSKKHALRSTFSISKYLTSKEL